MIINYIDGAMDDLVSYQHDSSIQVFSNNDDDTPTTNRTWWRARAWMIVGCIGALVVVSFRSHAMLSMSDRTASSMTVVDSIDQTDSSFLPLWGKSKKSSSSSDSSDSSSSKTTSHETKKQLKQRQHEKKQEAKAEKQREKERTQKQKQKAKELKQREKEEAQRKKLEAKAEKQRAKEEAQRKKQQAKEEKLQAKELAQQKKQQAKEEAREKKQEEKAAEKANKPPHIHYPKAMFMILMDLDSVMDGQVIFPWNGANWTVAKHVWNENAPHNPLIIIEAESERDVQAAMPLLAQLQLNYSFPFRVRSGGHNYAGYSSVKQGAILSLDRMNSTTLSHVDDETGTAIATLGPAARVQNVLDNILIPHGYSGVVGVCGGVAEAGFALNGGLGYLSRKYGLGLDSIRSLRIVLADGSVEQVSATENPDLFFALRGAGGGNFGVVTELKYLMHKSQDTQLAGTATMAYEDLGAFFQILGENDKDIPGEVFIYFETADEPAVLVNWFGPDNVSLEAGKKYLEEDLPALMPFNVTVELDTLSWTESTRAAGNLEGNLAQAWNGFLYADNNTLSVWNDIMSHIVAAIQESDFLIPDVELWGGAIGSIDPGETAFPHRGALFNVGLLLLVPKVTVNATDVYQAEVDKVNAFWSSLSQYMDGVYLNYQMESLDATEYPRQYWGNNLDRLVALKNKYDPTNVFNFPQSLPLVA